MNSFKIKHIKTETLGDRLKKVRKKRGIDLETVETETKVRVKYLKSFESGDYRSLPDDVYTIGFLRRYAEFLGLKSDKVVNDYLKEKGMQKSDHDPLLPNISVKSSWFFITPRELIISFFVIASLGLMSYIWFEFKTFTSPPPLMISNPTENLVVYQDSIEITGETDDTAVVLINNELVPINDQGRFNAVVRLQSGLNTIEIVAKNRVQKENSKTIKVLAKL